jgi:hypothetical protein
MPKMEAVIRVTYRVPLDTKVPDAEFQDLEPPPGPRHPEKVKAQVMVNEDQVTKARRQAAKDADAVVKEFKKENDVITALVEEVRET